MFCGGIHLKQRYTRAQFTPTAGRLLNYLKGKAVQFISVYLCLRKISEIQFESGG